MPEALLAPQAQPSAALSGSPRAEILARALSVERLLISTWRECFAQGADLALCAVGGFGRAELFPFSDVDLLILLPAKASPQMLGQVQQFQALAWQLKLDLAFSVRTAAQSLEFALEDVSFFTSLLDLRLLCGEASLVHTLKRLLSDDKCWAPRDFLAAKLAEQQLRHQRFADTAFNNEPNLKDGPGGLRDVQTLRWIAQREYQVGHWADLVEIGLISSAERQALESAETLLMQLRFALHRQAKRKEERLLFDHQIALAEQFGFVDQGFSNRAVEQMMQRYFRAAGLIERMNTMLIARMAEALGTPEANEIKHIDTNWCLRNGLLELAHAQHRPNVNEAFQALAHWQRQADATGLGPHFLRQLYAEIQIAPLPEPESFADDFLSLLDAPTRVAEAVQLAAKCGLLGFVWPAFERVTGRMQYDLFHAYTVDQHTLFVLQKLEALRSDTGAELPLAREVWKRIRQPRLLFLAALFHDIAKGRGGDHSELGAEDANQYLSQLGLPTADIALVSWLVQQHLSMSTTAQKRDIQDPAVIKQFALLVADRERLDHLYLLTIGDIRGTNPKLWNTWKARLLEDLYSATRFALRRGLENPVHAPERIAAAQAQAMALLLGTGATRAEVLAAWEDFPDAAFLRQSADEIRFQTQATLAAQRKQQRDCIAMRSIAGMDAFELFVRVPDRAGLFATIASVLDRLGMSVVGARIASTVAGFTHDTFQLQDARAHEQTAPRARALDVQMELAVALCAEVLAPKITRRAASRQQRHFQFPAQIEILPHDDFRSTLSLTCPESSSLLARVALCFFEHGVRLQSARIATFGERVEDIFLVSNASGGALTIAESETLAGALRMALGEAAVARESAA
jgi:[protein-PII] uridylyltransferase